MCTCGVMTRVDGESGFAAHRRKLGLQSKNSTMGPPEGHESKLPWAITARGRGSKAGSSKVASATGRSPR